MPRIIILSAVLVSLAAEDAITRTVTAERMPVDGTRTPAVVEIVEEAAIIDRGGLLNGSDWLRELPGVAVFNRYGGIDGGSADIRIRGVDPSFTQVLIDGLPLNDPTTIGGEYNPSFINPAGIERVEVLKGPQSGLYGSRALGGVIDYQSLRPGEQHRGAVRFTGGSFRTAGAEARASGPIGQRLGYAVGISGLTSRGFSAQTVPGSRGDPRDFEDDGVRRLSGTARLEARPAEDLLLYGSVFGQQAHQEYDGYDPGTFAGLPDDSASRWTVLTRRAAAGGSVALGATRLSLDAARTQGRRRDHGVGALPTTYAGEEDFVQARLEQRVGEGLRLGLGGDWRRERGRQWSEGQPRDWDAAARIAGAYAQGFFDSERVGVSLAGRLDQHRDFGTAVTGRAGLALWPVAQRVKLRATIANAFRAPSLYQLHGALPGWGYAGNPDLEPETAVAYEAGADWYSDAGLEAGLTLFRTQYRRKIVWYLDPGTWTSTYINLSDRAWVEGGEGALRAADLALGGPLRLDALLYGTVLRSDDGDGNDLAYVPRASGGARLTLRQEWSWRLWESVGVERTTGFATGAGGMGVVPGSTLVSAAVGADAGPLLPGIESLAFSVRVENLLDERYVLTSNAWGEYSTPPRAYYATLAVRY